MRRALTLLPLMALTACDLHFEDDRTQELASICEPIMFEDTPFTHCTAMPREHAIATDLGPELGGSPYRSLRELSRHREPGPPILMAMNAGMYDADGNPIGYYVEDGQRLTVLNQNDGPGNFHLLPNGVFFGDERGDWRVLETEAFAVQVQDRPHFATQSGPMLVIEGQLHPAFDADGDSRKIRNAVGVDESGRAHFIISEAPVSFGKTARLYRDVLNVRNALFLDGTVSQLLDGPRGRMDSGTPIGPIVLVTPLETEE